MASEPQFPRGAEVPFGNGSISPKPTGTCRSEGPYRSPAHTRHHARHMGQPSRTVAARCARRKRSYIREASGAVCRSVGASTPSLASRRGPGNGASPLAVRASRSTSEPSGASATRYVSRSCAISTARSHAAATTNLARSSHSFVLRLRFGGAKGSTLVDIFMIYADDWLATAESDSVLDLCDLMACNRAGGGGRSPMK
jgi:hypothetical protein